MGFLILITSGIALLGWFSSNDLFRDPSLGPGHPVPVKGINDAQWKGIEVGPLFISDSWVRFKNNYKPTFQDVQNDQFVTQLPEGVDITYSLNVPLQRKIEKVMKKYRLPYGMLIAMDPKTGRILAMVDYSRVEPDHENLNLRSSYPAASVFKLVTAAAGIEKKKVTPETQIAFHGGLWKLGPRNWKDNPKRDRDHISLKYALAKSCNVAFAKVALRWLGEEGLQCFAESFWFNKPIPFEFPVETSKAQFGPSEQSIALTAAGMGKVGLSPLHGAMIASAIANNGVMMVPKLVEKVSWDNGSEIYRFKEEPMTQIVSPQTADQLKEMMAYTVTKGTSRKAFHTRRGTPYIKGVSIGGKTGSLRGNDPKGKYSWFVGMAPLDDPEIALAALIVNKPIWHIKASHLAKEAFDAYFKIKESQTIALNK
jgi:cell division protein FtsI/penicillin-binding protein 2